MGKKNKPKSKVEMLLEWNKRPFIDKMLDDGESPNQVHKWIVENGFDVSMPTVYSYAKRRKEGIVKGIQLDQVMAPRGVSKETLANGKRGGMTKEDRREANLTVNKIQSDLEVLDAVMQKGYETLDTLDEIAPSVLLKALELKHKITGGAHNGITTYGLEEIRLRESARESAITVILLEFIPEEKHAEVLERMEIATKEFYESLGLGEQYEQLGEVEEG